MTATITMPMPASKPAPASSRWIDCQTARPNPPAPIIAAITTMERASIMVWLTPAMMVGSASGNCTLNSFWVAELPKASEASTSSLGTLRMPSAVSRITGATEKTIVAKQAETAPSPKKGSAGIR